MQPLMRIGLIAVTMCTLAWPSNFADEKLHQNQANQFGRSDDPRISGFETSLTTLAERTKRGAKHWSISDRMAAYGVPGASIAILEAGQIIWSQGYGVRSANSETTTDSQTVFSVGSVSKLVNAALVLRLVQEGVLDLDKDVNAYLKTWNIPDSKYTQTSKVTLRTLLSHTSGFNQHGFRDFEPGEDLPTLLQTLNGEPPAKHGPIELLFEPGSQMKYSGGGITVSQLIVEEVTGLSYAEAAQRYVFEPLGMTRSTFINPLPPNYGNIAKAHDKKGTPRALPRGYEAMPEAAASGLWTCADDMGLFIQAMLGNTAFLSDDLHTEMLTRQFKSWHGLGPRLNGSNEGRVFHHGGSNNSYQAWVEGHPATGNGIVILTNGQDGRQFAYEVRIAVERAFGWQIRFPDDYDEPDF